MTDTREPRDGEERDCPEGLGNGHKQRYQASNKSWVYWANWRPAQATERTEGEKIAVDPVVGASREGLRAEPSEALELATLRSQLQTLRDAYWNGMAIEDQRRPEYILTQFVAELDTLLRPKDTK